MRFFALWAVLVLAAKPVIRPTLAAAPDPGRRAITVRSGGYDWKVFLQVPSSTPSGRRLPLVLVFHGAGSGGERVLDQNGWAAKAEKGGFLAAAPDGQAARPHRPQQFFLNPRLWNDGQLRPGALRARIDDVAFVRDLIGELIRLFPLDESRIYAAGHSNGAGITFRLGAEISDRLAAIAAVAGHCWVEKPRPSRPLPTLYIVGTEDPVVPLQGGEVSLPWGRKTNPPVARTLEKWALGLGLEPIPRLLAGTGRNKIYLYGGETGPAFLKAIYIEGHGHGWPGGKGSPYAERLLGPAAGTFDATAEIWKFFESLSRR
jgi:polyhydroxybutyrate depolymerase